MTKTMAALIITGLLTGCSGASHALSTQPPLAAASSGPESQASDEPDVIALAGSQPGISALVYRDNFERESGWDMNEELVNSCAARGIGEVRRTLGFSPGGAYDGRYNLLVSANKANTNMSNHVIAGKLIATTVRTGRWRYEVHAKIDPLSAASGQAGPEFSMQNTRGPGNAGLTSTAGIQYRPSRFEPQPGSWAVWIETAPGTAAWHVFTDHQVLKAGQWYTIGVEADYTTNRYVRFWLGIGNKIVASRDLSSYRIAAEAKGFMQAFKITVESQNLYNNCGTDKYQYGVLYDQVTLQRD